MQRKGAGGDSSPPAPLLFYPIQTYVRRAACEAIRLRQSQYRRRKFSARCIKTVAAHPLSSARAEFQQKFGRTCHKGSPSRPWQAPAQRAKGSATKNRPVRLTTGVDHCGAESPFSNMLPVPPTRTCKSEADKGADARDYSWVKRNRRTEMGCMLWRLMADTTKAYSLLCPVGGQGPR